MTASLPSAPESKSPSRRALLAGALGGIGAWAASAIGRASPVRAEGETIHVGDEILTATSVTKISNQANGSAVLWGESNSGLGVYGSSNSGFGVEGISGSSVAIYGTSNSYTAIYGGSSATGQPAVYGQSSGNSTGVRGVSGGSAPAAKAKTGVYGYAAQDSSSKGIYGESPAGYAGYFAGKVYLSKYQEMSEMSTPSAPGANKARLFVRDNGSGKTQLCVRFPTGAVQVIKTEP